MTIPKNIKNTLRYKHTVARLSRLPAYRQEEALRREITKGPQWRIDAAIEAVNQTPANWNEINVTEVMKHAAMYGRLQTVDKISDSLEYKRYFHRFSRKAAPKTGVAPHAVQAAFHIATRHGRYRTADALVKRGAGPMYQAQGTPAAIYSAVAEGDIGKIDYLIRRGANKDYLVNLASTSEEYMKLTKYLVERHHAGVNFASEGFWTPFLNAVKYGRDDLATYLLEHGATPQNDRSAGEALYSAVGSNNVKMIKLMLQIGIAPDQQTLEHAIFSGHVEATKALLETGKVSAAAGNQQPLMLAIVAPKNADALVQLAIDNGADETKALAALKADSNLYRYGNRDKMISFLENRAAGVYPAAASKPAQPKAPTP